tara:strand:+ start:43 stop:756 length:714 start_codon:yes stop_codon:yes gene_type:complete
MKNLKILLLGAALTFNVGLAEDEEEQRYLEKDGTIYKINSSSLHLTPAEEDQKVSKASEEMESPSKLSKSEDSDEKATEPKCACDMTISMGTLTALGDGADDFDPGTSLSIKFPTKYNFNLFGRDFDVSAEVNLSNLTGINDDDNNIKAGIAHFHTEFDLPVNLTFGLGIAHLDQSGGIAGTGVLDVSYTLPVLDNDLSLGFRYQKFVDVKKEDPYLDFGLLDVYSLNLNYSKTLSF